MDKQQFLNNGNGSFPVSTETFAFLQDQITFVARLAQLVGGTHVIIEQSNAAKDGLVLIEGELFALKGTPSTHIDIVENAQDINANGITYARARIYRYATYATAGIPVQNFTTADTLHALKTQLDALPTQIDTLAQSALPKGTIIDYYRTINTFASCPYGFVPCGAFSYGGNAAYLEEWRNAYPNTTIVTYDAIGMTVRFVSCNGITVPDLTDRFIVAAGNTYGVGSTGGASTVKLTAEQSGVPKHTHVIGDFLSITGPASGSNKIVGSGSTTTQYGYTATTANGATNGNTAAGASQAHENRPPYYALQKIIKVI